LLLGRKKKGYGILAIASQSTPGGKCPLFASADAHLAAAQPKSSNPHGLA
jgi:hypothetical protein